MRSDEDDETAGESDRESGRDSALNSERNAEQIDADEWWVDRFILYPAREPMLWALLVVVLAHFAAFIASALLAALRTGHPVGVSVSLFLVVGTASGVRAEIRRKGRAAGLTWLLLATWLLSGAVAYLGDRFGLL